MNILVAEPGFKSPERFAWLGILGPGMLTGVFRLFPPLSPLRHSSSVRTAEPGGRSPEPTARVQACAEGHSGLSLGAANAVPKRQVHAPRQCGSSRSFQGKLTDRFLVGMLVGMRLRLAARRHDAHFLRTISPDAADPDLITGDVAEKLPPRSALKRPGRTVRAGLTPDQANRRAYLNAALNGIRAGAPPTPWAGKLRELLDDVRQRAECPDGFRLKPPEIRAIAKETGRRKALDGASYRVVTTYGDLADRLLIGAAARYLSEAFEPIFGPHSCAFRVSPSYSRSTAVKRLLDYVAESRGRPVFVAECDIRNFFDTVDHGVARTAYHTAVQRVEAMGGWVDPAATRVLEIYLDSYDYLTVGRPQAEAELRRRAPNGVLPGVTEDELRMLRPDGVMGRVGIPQGGALSPLLANLILDAADRAVVGSGEDPDLLYVRYCDDMIIMHRDKARCQAALSRYMAKLRELMFLAHPPVGIETYDKRFFGYKSKAPYRLADPAGQAGASAWLSFLGYQIRHDGAIRVRPDSVRKHRDKQAETVMRVMRLVRSKGVRLREDNGGILNRLAFRLVAAAVGRKEGCLAKGEVRCWTDAFPLLSPNRYSEWQMRRLDRSRDRMLAGMASVLRWLHPGNAGKKAAGEKQQARKRGKGRCSRPFLGKGLSYYGKLIGERMRSGRRVLWNDSGYGHY